MARGAASASPGGTMPIGSRKRRWSNPRVSSLHSLILRVRRLPLAVWGTVGDRLPGRGVTPARPARLPSPAARAIAGTPSCARRVLALAPYPRARPGSRVPGKRGPPSALLRPGMPAGTGVSNGRPRQLVDHNRGDLPRAVTAVTARRSRRCHPAAAARVSDDLPRRAATPRGQGFAACRAPRGALLRMPKLRRVADGRKETYG